MKVRSTLLLCLLTTLIASAQPGSLDPTFGGGDGFVKTSFVPNERSEGYGIASNGTRIAVAGYTRTPTDIDFAVLAVYKEDGTLDNTFNGSGYLVIETDHHSYGRRVAILPDGKILLAVTVYDTANVLEGALYQFNADGSPDNSFGDQGFVSTTFLARYLSVSAFTLQNDGKILMGGYVGYSQDTFDRFFVTRFLPNGTPDATFDGDGAVITSVGESWTHLNTLLVQPDHKIVAVGDAVFNQSDDVAVVRYHPNGSLDTGFGQQGIAHLAMSDGEDRAVGGALQPDGKIVIGGYAYSSIVDKPQFAAARFNADGTPDESFHGDGYNIISVSGHADGARAMTLQPDGKILLAGYAHSDINGGSDMAMVRLNQNGIPDNTFDDDGVAVYADNETLSSTLFAITLQPDGKALVTGWERFNGINNLRVARVLTGLTVATHDVEPVVTGLQLYPNPAHDLVSVDYTLERDELIRIQLYNAEGRSAGTLMTSAFRNAGENHEVLDLPSGLIPGSYLVSIESVNGKKAVRIVVR